MSSRREVVEALVNAATDSMHEVARDGEASNDEVMSAYFTLLRRGIQAAVVLSNDRRTTRKALRESLYTILADCTDEQLH